MKKLSRKEIAEGLDSVPINQILLGSGNAGVTLTKKQKAFAEEVVKTGNKTKAYKKAYNHTGKQTTAQRNAQTIVSNSKVATYIQALEQAKAAETYLLPARLRSIAIHRLTGLALNDEINPAQQLKALELIGKMTEVALFTERRELVKVTDSADMRDQLMKSIRLAFSTGGAIDVEASEVDSLLDEISGKPLADAPDLDHAAIDSDRSADTLPISGGEASKNEILLDPPDPDPQKTPTIAPSLLHSIPLTKSPSKTVNPQRLTGVSLSSPLESDTCVSTGVNPNKDTPPSEAIEEGEGVNISSKTDTMSHLENPPVSVSNEKA
jgi:phage terminase small subunit